MKKRIKDFGGLNVFLLGLTSLINDFGSEMIAPILPLLLSSFGATGLIIGIVGGILEGFPNLFKIFSGYLSDKIENRKKFIFTGYFTSELAKLMLYLANGWKSLLFFLAFVKIGKGIREAPRDALISESMPKEKGKAFGIQRAFDISGAILGSIAVLLLVYLFNPGFKPIIFIAALVGFISLIPLYFVRDVYGEVKNSKKAKMRSGFVKDLKHLPGKLKFFIFAAGLFALANFSYMFFILKSADLFSFSFFGAQSKFVVPLILYVLFNIFYALFAIPFGKLSDEIGRRKVIVAGYILFSAVCLGFFIFDSFYIFVALFCFYGLAYAMIAGNQRAIVADLSSKQHRATALGIFHGIMGLMAIVAGITAGYLYDINSDFTFIYGAILSFISAIILLSSFEKYPNVIED